MLYYVWAHVFNYLSEFCGHIMLEVFGRLCSGVFISTFQPTDKLLQHSGCAGHVNHEDGLSFKETSRKKSEKRANTKQSKT